MDSPNTKVNLAEETQSTPKKLYEKPAIVYRAQLEAMANACLGFGLKRPGDLSCTIGNNS